MSRQVTIPVFPLHIGIRASAAVPTGFVFGTTFTPFARLDDFEANPTFIGTALGRHERTFMTFFDGVANHGNHPLLIGFCICWVVQFGYPHRQG